MKQFLFIVMIAFGVNHSNTSAQSFFEFYFNAGGVRYDALLWIDAYSNASIRVKFYDPEYRRYLAIDEGGFTTVGPRGVAITCNYVVWANTTTNASYYYVPDNFFLGYDDYGNPLLFNYDANGTYSQVKGLRKLNTYADYLSAYNRFIGN